MLNIDDVCVLDDDVHIPLITSQAYKSLKCIWLLPRLNITFE